MPRRVRWRTPPAWCTTPAQRTSISSPARVTSAVYPAAPVAALEPFDVITCIHHAGNLFTLNPTQLAARCQVEPTTLPPDSRKTMLITNAFHFSGRLSWHQPLWTRPCPDAKWWIVFNNRLATPVAWQPEIEATPLLTLDLADHRPLIVRLFSRLRRHQ